MSKEALTTSELYQELTDQIELLENSMTKFDSGSFVEAKNMATKIRVLLYDREPKSKALLTQLNIKGATVFLDTAQEFNPNVRFAPESLAFIGLLQLSFSFGKRSIVTFRAPLDDIPVSKIRYINFDDWWNQSVVHNYEGNGLSRNDLIMLTADQAGGAHVDPKVDAIYNGILRKSSTGIQITCEGKKYDFNLIIQLSIRQIAHEVLKSINPGYPEQKGKILVKIE